MSPIGLLGMAPAKSAATNSQICIPPPSLSGIAHETTLPIPHSWIELQLQHLHSPKNRNQTAIRCPHGDATVRTTDVHIDHKTAKGTTVRWKGMKQQTDDGVASGRKAGQKYGQINKQINCRQVQASRGADRKRAWPAD